jgi:hypothetical protein
VLPPLKFVGHTSTTTPKFSSLSVITFTNFQANPRVFSAPFILKKNQQGIFDGTFWITWKYVNDRDCLHVFISKGPMRGALIPSQFPLAHVPEFYDFPQLLVSSTLTAAALFGALVSVGWGEDHTSSEEKHIIKKPMPSGEDIRCGTEKGSTNIVC